MTSSTTPVANSDRFEVFGPYDSLALQADLDALAGLIPSLVAIRTDRFHAEPISDRNPLRLILEHGAHGRFRMGVPDDPAAAPTGHIAREFGIDATAARAVLVAATRLVDRNANGAWTVRPTPVPALTVSRSHANGRPLNPTDYLAETCEILADELKGVGSIRIDYLVQSDRGGRRRAFLRFMGRQDDTEVAAIDAGGIALHARQQILKDIVDSTEPAMQALNLWRMQRWAEQLGTTPDALAEIFPILVFFSSSLHVTKIELQ